MGEIGHNLTIACVIPARGGSKAIPKKNIVDVGGKPLVGWSISQALESHYLQGNVFVSSDSDEILAVASMYLAHPIKRPPEISGDHASSESALIHALDVIEQQLGKEVDLLVFLQPTSPLRKKGDIDQAIEKFITSQADSLLSVYPIQDFFIWSQSEGCYCSENFDYTNRQRRQELPVKYLENGSLYICQAQRLRETHNRLGGKIEIYPMDRIHSFQVDDPEDLAVVDYFLRKYYV